MTTFNANYASGRQRPGAYYVGPQGATDPLARDARTLSAKFDGVCPLCKKPIVAGSQVRWQPGRKAVHLACPPEAEVVDVQTPLANVARDFTDEQLERAILTVGDDLMILAVLDAELDARMAEAIARAEAAEPVFGERPGEQEWMGEQVAVGDVEPAPVPQDEPAPAREPLTVEHQGVYVLPDGAVVRVKANQAKTRVYASRWVETHQDRLMADGTHKHGEYVFEPGLIRQVQAEGRKMTFEEAKTHSALYGSCVRCGRHLVDGKSVEAGMGPICRKYFQG